MARRIPVLPVFLALTLSSCSVGDTDTPLFTGAPVVMVTMDGYNFDYDPGIASGQVVFRFVNAGDTTHAPILQPLGDDLPAIDAQLRGPNRVTVEPFAGVLPVQPGETRAIVVFLEPDQRYALICTASDDGESHALKGMTSEFRTPPRPDDNGS